MARPWLDRARPVAALRRDSPVYKEFQLLFAQRSRIVAHKSRLIFARMTAAESGRQAPVTDQGRLGTSPPSPPLSPPPSVASRPAPYRRLPGRGVRCHRHASVRQHAADPLKDPPAALRGKNGTNGSFIILSSRGLKY